MVLLCAPCTLVERAINSRGRARACVQGLFGRGWGSARLVSADRDRRPGAMAHVETVVNAHLNGGSGVWKWNRRRRAGRPAGLTGPGLAGGAQGGGGVDADARISWVGGGEPDCRSTAGRPSDARRRRVVSWVLFFHFGQVRLHFYCDVLACGL